MISTREKIVDSIKTDCESKSDIAILELALKQTQSNDPVETAVRFTLEMIAKNYASSWLLEAARRRKADSVQWTKYVIAASALRNVSLAVDKNRWKARSHIVNQLTIQLNSELDLLHTEQTSER